MSKEKEDNEIIVFRIGNGCFLLFALVALMALAITSLILGASGKKPTPKDIIEQKNLVWEQYLEIKKNTKD